MANGITTAGYGRAPRGEGGFSLIEAMIGAALLLLIVLGVLPLFTRAMIDNAAGADYTRTTNHARSAAENLFQLSFNDTVMTVPTTGTSLVAPEFYSELTKRWQPNTGTLPVGTQWLRTTTVRQYGLSDVIEDGIFDRPLPGDTFPSAVHVKEIEVRVESAGVTGALGARKQMQMRLLKSF